MISIVNVTGSNSKNLYYYLSEIDNVELITTPEELNSDTNAIFLPGVGSFGFYSDFLNNNGWNSYIKNTQTKVIGICSGYHALCTSSEEDPEKLGLGFFDSQVTKITAKKNIEYGKVPHVGQRLVSISNQDINVFFIHSYGVLNKDKNNVLQDITISDDLYVAAEKNNNIYGLQYHPELSGDIGRIIVKNIIK
ncbi:MAG: glutamine amidotransferase [Flavobacteriales bacterium]|jgi:glutamine amidotransferase